MNEVRCLHQVIRSKAALEGYGNCRKCIPDKLNEQCAGYTPVRWRLFEVKAIQNSSLPNENVYDPFLGSGTTLIAADQLDRICYGLEISPVYCDVIVKRYIAHKGSDADVFLERDGVRIPYSEVMANG